MQSLNIQQTEVTTKLKTESAPNIVDISGDAFTYWYVLKHWMVWLFNVKKKVNKLQSVKNKSLNWTERKNSNQQSDFIKSTSTLARGAAQIKLIFVNHETPEITSSSPFVKHNLMQQQFRVPDKEIKY